MPLNRIRRNNARIADAVNLSMVSMLVTALNGIDFDLNQPISRFKRFCRTNIPTRDIPLITISTLVSPMTILGLTLVQPDVRILQVILASGMIVHVNNHDILTCIYHFIL